MTVFLLQVVHQWPGLPKGVKFDPSDQELIWHLRAKHGKAGIKPHPFIDEFIPTVEEDEGICYTHPQKLPGTSIFFLKDYGIFMIKVLKIFYFYFQIRSNVKICSLQLLSNAYLC